MVDEKNGFLPLVFEKGVPRESKFFITEPVNISIHHY
jgi:hypothetical protein